MEDVRILATRDEISGYVDAVRSSADQNKKSLGFLPASVFSDYARREKLLVAVNEKSGEYLGYLLFGVKYPAASVLQIFCKPEARGKGVARQLIDSLKKMLGSYDCTSIKARVAEDLVEANSFWASQGFVARKRVRGGVTTGREIIVRIYNLDSPQLFPHHPAYVSGNSLGLPALVSAAPPMYLIDLNVVFDYTQQRVRHDMAQSIFQSFYAGECKLAISDEMRRELERTARPGQSDRMISLIEALPTIPMVVKSKLVTMQRELAGIVFPERSANGELSVNDLSDIHHLITAIDSKVAGFITSDGRILDAAHRVKNKYGLQIFSPGDFITPVWSGATNSEVNADVNGVLRFEVKPFSGADYDGVRDMLFQAGIPISEIVGGWLPSVMGGAGSNRMVVHSQGAVAGFIFWTVVDPSSREVRIRAIQSDVPAGNETVAKLLLRQAIEANTSSAVTRLSFDVPVGQSLLVEASKEIGFRETEIAGKLEKISIGAVITAERWNSLRALLAPSKIILPNHPPKYVGYSQLIEIGCPDGQFRCVRLDEIETMLSPLLLCLDGRPAVIVPIQPQYSLPLIGHSKQLSLAPKLMAEYSVERLYLAGPRLLKKFVRGGLILFYESGRGAQAIVAIARITDSYLIQGDSVEEESLSRSVLTKRTMHKIGVSKFKSACVFDNIVVFPSPVSLAMLKELDHGPGKLMCANSIGFEKLKLILDKGFDLE